MSDDELRLLQGIAFDLAELRTKVEWGSQVAALSGDVEVRRELIMGGRLSELDYRGHTEWLKGVQAVFDSDVQARKLVDNELDRRRERGE